MIEEKKLVDGNETEFEKRNPWIPASVMPENMKTVLVWFEYFRYGEYNRPFQTYGLGYALDGKWSPLVNGESGWKDLKILAWMPLPEPYKTGD